MSFNTTIREVMHDADNLMSADEPVKNARPQFELETARSLILIDETGPVGLLTRSRMRQIAEEEMGRPARDFLVPVPMLLQTQTLAEARKDLELLEFDADRVPVINEEGRFVGVINREVLQRDSSTAVMDHGTFQIRGNTEVVFPVQSGMSVIGSDDSKLGKVDEITVNGDTAVSFTVEHGLLGRHHKRVAAEHVTNCDEENVYLNFGKQEFGLLANVEDLDEEQLPAAAT
ncbi:MAG: CBS domain-containing protein [Thermomicrobiales bacterium]